MWLLLAYLALVCNCVSSEDLSTKCQSKYDSPQQPPPADLKFGDMKLTEQQKRALSNGEEMGVGGDSGSHGYSVKNGNNLRWTDGIIPYEIDCSLENLQDAADSIKLAMQEWENKTCIRFVKRTNEKYFLQFFRNTHCWGNVGMTSYTRISVGYGCEYQHVMTHEIGHVVGFYHEQNRKDRRDWVTVHWNNIAKFKDAFDIVNDTSSLGVSYDYASIMHYPWNAFSSNGKDTMSPKQPLNGKTPYIELSKDDAEQTSRAYNCPAIERKRKAASALNRVGNIREKRGEVRVSSCVDESQYCADWAKHGHCIINKDLHLICKFSCKSPTCKNVCLDRNIYCPDWAKAGYCSTNTAVGELCKKSCHSPSCHLINTPSPVTTTQTPKVCLDRNIYCPDWAKSGYCSTNTAVAELCKKSCHSPSCHVTTPRPPFTGGSGHLTNPPTASPPVKPHRTFLGKGVLCRDTRPQCTGWAARGECQSNPIYMKNNCALSCKHFSHCDNGIQKPAGQCAQPLGLAWDGIGKGFQLPDSAFHSPAHLSSGVWQASAMNARLYFEDDYDRKRIGAWCASSLKQVGSSTGYIQVDLGRKKTISYIATQGRHKYFERVATFQIKYSNDGVNFSDYKQNGVVKTFDGNCDHRTPVLNRFTHSIRARYIRYVPVKSNFPCVRMEFYGC